MVTNVYIVGSTLGADGKLLDMGERIYLHGDYAYLVIDRFDEQ